MVDNYVIYEYIMRHIIYEFEDRVSKNSDKIIVENSYQKLSYKDVSLKSNQICMLVEEMYSDVEIIPVLLKNDINALPTYLGIIKAGKIVLPLSLSLSLEENLKRISDIPHGRVMTDIDDIANSYNINSCLLKGFSRNWKFNNNLIIIMTSGTTGIPKKVLLCNENLYSFFESYGKIGDYSEKSTVLFSTTCTFDPSLIEIFAPVYYGSKIICFDKNDAEYKVANYTRIVNKYRVTHIVIVPTLMSILLETNKGIKMESVRFVGFGGEKIYADTVIKARQVLPNARIFNLYGPAETTICVTYYEVTNLSEDDDIPIGYPFENAKIVVESDNDTTGEILIGGKCVSKGYYNEDSEKFISINGERYYKSGDYGYIKDGVLYYIGRKDSQYKVNGIRIELNEVVSIAKQVIGVSSVYAEVFNGVIYIYLSNKCGIDKKNIEEELSARISRNISVRLVLVDRFITTVNGKFDFRAMRETYVNSIDRIDEFTEYMLNEYGTTSFEKLNSIEKVRMALFFCQKYNVPFSENMTISLTTLRQNVNSIVESKQNNNLSEEDFGGLLKNKEIETEEVFSEAEGPLIYFHYRYMNNISKYGFFSINIGVSDFTGNEIVDVIIQLMKNIDIFSITLSKKKDSFVYKKFTSDDFFVWSEERLPIAEVRNRLGNIYGKPLYLINYVLKEKSLTFFFSHFIISAKGVYAFKRYVYNLIENRGHGIEKSSYMNYLLCINKNSKQNYNDLYKKYCYPIEDIDDIKLNKDFVTYEIDYKNIGVIDAVAVCYLLLQKVAFMKSNINCIGSSVIIEPDASKNIIGDTHTICPLVSYRNNPLSFYEISDKLEKIYGLKDYLNLRDKAVYINDEKRWKRMPFTINYLGEKANLELEISKMRDEEYTSRYILAISSGGKMYVILYSDFIQEKELIIMCEGNKICIKRCCDK